MTGRVEEELLKLHKNVILASCSLRLLEAKYWFASFEIHALRNPLKSFDIFLNCF